MVAAGAVPEAARSREPRLSSQPALKCPVRRAKLSTLAFPVYHIGEAIRSVGYFIYLMYSIDYGLLTNLFINSRGFPGGVSYSRESTPDSGGSHPYLEAYHRDTAGKEINHYTNYQQST